MKYEEKRNEFYVNEELNVNLSIKDNTIQAIVKGNPDHEVNITLGDGEILEAYCDCENGKEGNYCEHIITAIEALEKLNGELSKIEIFQNDEDNYLEDLIKRANREDIDRFLLKVLDGNYDLLELFEKYVDMDDEDVFDQADDRINETFNIFNINSDKYCDYDYAYEDLDEELCNIIDEEIQYFIGKEEYDEALSLLIIIFERFDDIEDNYIDTLYNAEEEIYDVLKTLLKKADSEVKYETFDLILSLLDNEEQQWIHSTLLNLLMNNCPKEFEEEKIDFLEEKNQELSENEDISKKQRYQWETCYADSMIGLPKYKEQLNDFCMEHLDNIDLVEILVNQNNLKGNFDQSLDIINKCNELNKDDNNIQGDLKLLKMDIYKLQGDKQKYLEILEDLITNYYPDDLDLLDALKEEYSEEAWSQKRQEILDKMPDDLDNLPILAHEEMYDELFEKVMECDGFDSLFKYDYVLKEHYPTEIINKYTELLEKHASLANEITDYQHILIALYGLSQITGGKEVAKVLINKWNLQYKDKPEFLALLKRFNF